MTRPCERCGSRDHQLTPVDAGISGMGEYLEEMLCPLCAMVAEGEKLGLYDE